MAIEHNLEKQQKTYLVAVASGVVVFIVVLIVILIFKSQNSVDSGGNNSSVSLSESFKNQAKGGLKPYQDPKCKVNFSYPDNWELSSLKLPLPQKPLSAVTFDELTQTGSPKKNSIFSYICYDAKKYSFNDLVPLDIQEEAMTIGNTKWKRKSNFVYTIHNDKLLIFQMFFTKNDIKPLSGYEELFIKIIQSVKYH